MDKIEKEIDLGEYVITVEYDGAGGLKVCVLDELREEIEHIAITNDTELPSEN